jgi:signal transduction histidine kinase
MLAKRLDASVSGERAARTDAERQLLRLQQAEADLDAAVRARDEFLRNASHELRTPMTSLSLHYQRLLRSALGKAVTLRPDEMERFLRTSERQFQRLNQLIDNLLDAGKETRGRIALNLEEVDLAELVRQAAERVHEQIVASGSRFDLDLDAPVEGSWDRLRIMHVVCNLLSNAARYGQGNPIRVELRRGVAVARLRVEDHGIGIPERDLPRVFDRFNHAGALRDASGLGVGLYVARAIVEAHGGTLCVESCLGRGSTFTVELPGAVPLDAALFPPGADGEARPLAPDGGNARA